MVQPPRPPPTPSGPGGIPPNSYDAPYQGQVPNHYRPPPRRGLTPTTAIGIALGCGVAAFGAYVLFAGPSGPSGEGVQAAVEAVLAKTQCANPGGAVIVELLVSDDTLDVFTADTPEPTASCLAVALSGTRVGAVDPTTLVQVKLTIGFDAKGQASLAAPAVSHRLEADWNVGALGEEISAKRSRIGTLLEAGLPDLVACYADGAVRAVGRLPVRSWHTKDQVQVRLRIEPDGSIAGMEVKRPGVGFVADWASQAGYINCVKAALPTLNWPAHDGAKWNWVNTTFEVGQVAI